MGKKLGDATDPLLVSVRSGAKQSMPGMMDTVLNLGLNDESVLGLAAQTDNERFAFDSYRRFIAMYAEIVLGLAGEAFDRLLETAREWDGVELDRDPRPDPTRPPCGRYQQLVPEQGRAPFPPHTDVHPH